MWWVVFLFLVVLCVDEGVHGWTLSLSSTTTTRTFSSAVVRPHASTTTRLALSAKEEEDEDELIARRIVVEGDVQGGYYRSCVLNEVGGVVPVMEQRTQEKESEKKTLNIFLLCLGLLRLVFGV